MAACHRLFCGHTAGRHRGMGDESCVGRWRLAGQGSSEEARASEEPPAGSGLVRALHGAAAAGSRGQARTLRFQQTPAWAAGLRGMRAGDWQGYPQSMANSRAGGPTQGCACGACCQASQDVAAPHSWPLWPEVHSFRDTPPTPGEPRCHRRMPGPAPPTPVRGQASGRPGLRIGAPKECATLSPVRPRRDPSFAAPRRTQAQGPDLPAQSSGIRGVRDPAPSEPGIA